MTGIVYTQTAMYEDTDSLFGKIAQQHWNHWHETAIAYIWGRADGGDKRAKALDSYVFGGVYALAKTVTDGCAPPLQDAFHEYVLTGRILVRAVGRRGVVQVYAPARNGTSWAECVHIPWVGEQVPYWGGVAPLHDAA